MRKFKFLTLTLIGFFLVSSAAAQPLPRGDYDNDGIQDLAVGLVNRRAGTISGSTAYLVRGSSLGQLFWTFPRPTDAYAPGRFFQNWGTVPGSVLVTSGTEPLLWTIKAPNGSEVLVRFGLNGDIVTNLIDWDGDRLDDFLVVRRGAVNEFGDGRSYLHWFIALSAYGGGIIDHVFGQSGDRVFSFFSDGRPHMGAVRIGTSGECIGQLEWWSMNFSLNVSERQIVKRCWGLPGDIPIVRTDLNNNGLADWIVVRPEGHAQIAYILYDNQQEWTTRALGLSNAVPQVGNFMGEGNTFGWCQRDQGLVGLRRLDGTDAILPFGIATNAIIRPDGTVVQSNASDRLTSQPEPTPTPINPPPSGCPTFGRGELWKPAGETRGGVPVFLVSDDYAGIPNSSIRIEDQNGNLVPGFRVVDRSCCPNGGRAHFWVAPKCGQIPANSIVRFGNQCRSVPSPCRRYE